MHLNNIYEWISEIVSLLVASYYSEGFEGGRKFTVRDIAEKLNVSVPIVRETIIKMLENDAFSCWIMFDTDDDEIEYDDDEIVIRKLRSGQYDDTVVGMGGSPLTDGDGQYLIPFTKIEMPSVKHWFKSRTPLFQIKRKYGVSKKLQENLEVIHHAIDQEKAVECVYKDTQGKINYFFRCVPREVRISYEDAEKAKLVTHDGQCINICGMNNIRLHDKPFEKNISVDMPDEWDTIWYTTDDEDISRGPEHVKLEIRNSTRNIISKIEDDTRRRKHKKCSSGPDGIVIYEDDVSGFADFKKWVMGYGSSIRVLEPLWLANDIREEFEKMARQYESGKFECH